MPSFRRLGQPAHIQVACRKTLRTVFVLRFNAADMCRLLFPCFRIRRSALVAFRLSTIFGGSATRPCGLARSKPAILRPLSLTLSCFATAARMPSQPL
jgi:hypothetical protein